MFERRLKISLGILLSMMSILLLRAVHLQVITKAQWVQAAEDFKKKETYIETTRGRILDWKGHELAIDEACMDACVDYRAITRDAAWIREVAIARAKSDTETWTHANAAKRKSIIEETSKEVKSDIDNMFVLLAKETGRHIDQIESVCQQIDLRVAMSRRIRQYKRYEDAQKEDDDKEQPAWYRRWIVEGGKDGPQIDDYQQTEGEEVGIHPLVRNISTEAYLRLARALPRCPGLQLRPGTHRNYPYNKAACHLLGAVTTVTKEDIATNRKLDDPLRSYSFNDTVGRGGLESLLEPTLRGTRGLAYRQPGKDDQVVKSPVPGSDVKTTIDIELQDQIQKLFEHMEVPSNRSPKEDPRKFHVAMHGAAVVIDIKTGDVRALASYPDYDVNSLSENIETFLADGAGDKLLNAPLLNRATQSQLEPGSTIKPVVGLSAITQGLKVGSHGVITARTGIECTGFLVLNKHEYPNGKCWVASKFLPLLGKAGVSHHPVPAPHEGVYGNPNGFLCYADALERSCNVYFETLADAFGTQGLSYWYDKFGLGRETGLGISEACGFLPNQLKIQQPSVAWFSGIGQVGVRATPIQMANVAATIARDGIWMRPRLVEDGYTLNPVPTRDGTAVPDRIDLKLDKEALAAAKDGMIRVVNSETGTGPNGRMTEMLVAGKTGTAQAAEIKDPVRNPDGTQKRDEKGKLMFLPRTPAYADHETQTPWYRGWGEDGKTLNHSWFIGFAPANDPQVAFAVMVQYGGSGGYLAANTARGILTACIEHGYIKPTR